MLSNRRPDKASIPVYWLSPVTYHLSNSYMGHLAFFPSVLVVQRQLINPRMELFTDSADKACMIMQRWVVGVRVETGSPNKERRVSSQ